MPGYENEDHSHQCNSCGLTKPRSEFYKRNDRPIGIASQCKACSNGRYAKWRVEHKDKRHQDYQAWIKAHPEETKAFWRKANKKRYDELRVFLNDIKNVPCLDCGLKFHPCAMDFDHRDPKTKKEVVSRVGYFRTKKKLLEEISKCDIVCSNCHRLRTFKRNQSE
jgi:hypothetical protein